MKQQILAEMKVKPEIHVDEEVRKRVDFLKYNLTETGMRTLVLGISGGVDSTVCGKLCQMAVNELGSDYRFIAVRLPHGVQADEDDAQDALKFINPSKVVTIDVEPGTSGIHFATMSALWAAGEEGVTKKNIDFVKGNVKARMRMIAQYEIAGLTNGLVVGTDHSAEAVVGFYTKHGDGACDLAPLFGLNKRQVRSLGEYLGAPDYLFNKEATADLEEDKEQLPDEQALGLDYDEIDDFLEGREVSDSADDTIVGWYLTTQHKRHPARTPE
jgi:NAD+ synthase